MCVIAGGWSAQVFHSSSRSRAMMGWKKGCKRAALAPSSGLVQSSDSRCPQPDSDSWQSTRGSWDREGGEWGWATCQHRGSQSETWWEVTNTPALPFGATLISCVLPFQGGMAECSPAVHHRLASTILQLAGTHILKNDPGTIGNGNWIECLFITSSSAAKITIAGRCMPLTLRMDGITGEGTLDMVQPSTRLRVGVSHDSAAGRNWN